MASASAILGKTAPVRALKSSSDVRFYFAADSHDGFQLLDRFVKTSNENKPAFVLSGGDMTEVGTAKEHAATAKALGKLQVPLESIPGNHDYRGSERDRFVKDFGTTPRSFDRGGVHFILLDDANQHIDASTFSFLERDLAANQGKPTVVAMHVPAVGKDVSAVVAKLHARMPASIAYPKLEDPAQSARFTDLMSRYNVNLVLAGHTHVPDERTVGGVRYVTAGALGGKLTKVGSTHEYLDVALHDGKVDVKHVALDAPADGIKGLIADDGRYVGRQVQTLTRGSFSSALRRAFGDLIEHFHF